MSHKNTAPGVCCLVKLLPKTALLEAAQTAMRINPANGLLTSRLKRTFAQASIDELQIAVLTSKYWGAAGVHLSVSFMDNPPAELKAKILLHMNAWSEFANVSFTEVDRGAQVRVALTPGAGHWSYLGTDILHIPADKPTMNLDSFSLNTPDSEFYRVVRHEAGHTLGFLHEHMRQEIVDNIDREAAITYFGRTQGWTRQEVINQVLNPLQASAIKASAHADPHSVMCYWLPGQIMKDRKDVPGGRDIDEEDKKFAALMYPKTIQSAKAVAPLLADIETEKSSDEVLMMSAAKVVKTMRDVATSVEYNVKKIIIKVSRLGGTPDQLTDDTTLDELNFNTAMCYDLAHKLDIYVKAINQNAGIDNAQMSTGLTVKQVVDIVKNALKS